MLGGFTQGLPAAVDIGGKICGPHKGGATVIAVHTEKGGGGKREGERER